MPNPYDKYGKPSNLDELFPSTPYEPYQPRRRATPPLRQRKPAPEPKVIPEEEDKGWFREWGPSIARGVGGFAGFTPLTGIAGGAAGEIAAQAIEQGDWTPDIDYGRVGAEAAIGGVGGGFAKMLGMGASVGRAALAGAAMGGSAPVLRHGIEEGNWDPTEYGGEIGTGAAVGGVVGGGLAKLLNMTRGTKPAGPASRYEIETTAVPGGRVLGGTEGQKTQFVNPVRAIHGTGGPTPNAAPAPTTRVPYAADEVPNAPMTEPKVPYMGGEVAPLPSQVKLMNDEARAAERAAKETERLRIAAEKQELEKTKLGELQKLFAGRGDVETRLNESVSAVDPATGHRLGANFREVVEDEADDAGGSLGSVLSNQADEPVETIQQQIERVKAEIAQQRGAAPETPIVTTPDQPISFDEVMETATPGPMARLDELRAKSRANTLTGDELMEARALDSDLRGRGFPPDEPPSMVPVAPEPPPQGPLAPASMAVEPEVPPSPLAELLNPAKAGKARSKRAGKSKSERFDERAAKMAAEAEGLQAPVAPEALVPQAGRQPLDYAELDRQAMELLKPKAQSLAELMGQVDPSNPGVKMYVPGEGAIHAPIGAGADDAMAALRSQGPEVPTATPELPPAPPEAIPGLTKLFSGLRPAAEGLDIIGQKGRFGRLREEFKAGGGKGRHPEGSDVSETGKTLRWAGKQLEPQAPKPVVEAPVAPTPGNWIDDEAAMIAKLEALPPDQRMAAFLDEGTASPPPNEISMLSEAPTTRTPEQMASDRNSISVLEREIASGGGTPELETLLNEIKGRLAGDVEPDWVKAAMAEVDGLNAAKPAPKEPIKTVAELEALLGGAQATPASPAVTPTASQLDELQRLRMQSGAIQDPNEVPNWMNEVIQQAPEAPLPAPKPKAKGKGKAAAPAPPPQPTILTKPGQEGAPRLSKGGKYGAGHDGPPNPQQYRPEYKGPKTPDPTKGGGGERGEVSTALAAHLGMGIAGAAIGGATDPMDDPLLSAMAGGAVGLSIPTMAKGLMSLGAPGNVVQDAMNDIASRTPDAVKRAVTKIGRVLPQMQRANYLADLTGLPANAWFGPYGSGVFGALERAMDGDPRGWAVLKELANPWNFFKEYPSAFAEARDLVGRAEGFSEAEAVGNLEKKLTWPGTALTGGDVAIRRILTRNGYSDDEARIWTMTGEPFTKSGESLAHLRGFVPDVTFPFKRTPINIAEQGFLRTPGLGFLMQGIGNARGTRAADSLAMQAKMQGMGLGVGLGTEQLSEHMTPEQARFARRFVTNSAGPYSLLAGAGMVAGQARRRGQPVAGAMVRGTAQQMPLPTIEPLQDNAAAVAKLVDGQPLRESDIPRGAYPSGLKLSNVKRQYDALSSFFGTETPLPPRRRRRSS